MPRTIRMRPRKNVSAKLKVDKSCRIGRDFQSFRKYMSEHPDASVRQIDSVEELKKREIKVHKIFLFTGDLEMLDKIKRRLIQNPELAVASSFYNNLEITAKGAEKGPAIQEYIESLGYTKDEVMVFGDSLNDYSMLSMDFGATVAMENADEEVKRVSKYITKSNEDFGVAYTIHELLKKQGKINSTCE